MPNASAIVIILPVVHVERTWGAPSPIKPRPTTTAKPVTVKSAAAKQAAKSEPVRKRRKRVAASALPSPACSGG
jgi:hypothetical protein